MSKWELTDDASNQHVRVISEKDGIYEVIDVFQRPNDWIVLRGTVTIKRENVDEPNFIETYLKPYGYDDFADVKDIYETEAHAMQIIVECIFETDGYRIGNIIKTGDFEDCWEFVKTLCDTENASECVALD